MLTHAEADHEGAAPQVIAAYHPRLVVDGGAGWPSRVQRALPSAARRIHAPAAGETIALGALRFDVLWPPPRAATWLPTGNPNDNALVTRLEADGLTVLLTADAESNVLDAAGARAGGRAEGLPSRQRRPRAAAAARRSCIRGSRRSRSAATTPTAIRHRRRWPRCEAVPTVVRTDRDGTVRLHAARDRMWVER